MQHLAMWHKHIPVSRRWPVSLPVCRVLACCCGSAIGIVGVYVPHGGPLARAIKLGLAPQPAAVRPSCHHFACTIFVLQTTTLTTLGRVYFLCACTDPVVMLYLSVASWTLLDSQEERSTMWKPATKAPQGFPGVLTTPDLAMLGWQMTPL